MRTCFFLWLCLTITSGSLAQNRANHWFFGGEQFNPFTAGNSVHLDFNSGQPSVKTDGRMFSRESAASISDANGLLLFYTNGIEVFNAQGDTMPNGSQLKSSTSTTQGSIIVPHPGNSHQYFLFSLTLQAQQDGLHYSIVDMTKDNGLGDVVLKNEPLRSPLTEKMAAVHHANGKDFWLLVHGYQNNEFYAYRIDENGVDTSPVTSAIGPKMGLVPQDLNATLGNMKFSHCGQFLACAMYSLLSVDFYRFDNSTGVLCDHLKITSPDEQLNFNQVYGLEWSPDDSKVYAGTYQGGQIFQFSLDDYSQSAIKNSITDMGNCNCTTMGDLQLAPDGKIYVTYEFQHALGVIENPNADVPSAKYIVNSLMIDTTQALRLSLPDFVSSLVVGADCGPEVARLEFLGEDTALCTGSELTLDATHTGASYRWSDGSTNPRLTVTGSGTYWVEVKISECILRTDTIEVSFGEFSASSKLRDTTICRGDSCTFEAGIGEPATYRWSTGSTDSTLIAHDQGSYWVEVKVDACTIRDTALVTFHDPLWYEPLEGITSCEGDLVALSVPTNGSVVWSDGVSGKQRTVDLQGTYRFNVHNTCESLEDSVSLTFANCNCKVFVPNAFTPNGDATNEGFKAVVNCELDWYDMQIYNRWGELIYRTSDTERSWDGTYRGSACMSGGYLVIIKGKGPHLQVDRAQMVFLLEGRTHQ